jgi:hypothetical protein
MRSATRSRRRDTSSWRAPEARGLIRLELDPQARHPKSALRDMV